MVENAFDQYAVVDDDRGMQLVTERGYCQLDDVVMNTLGGCLGYGGMRIIDAVHRRLHHS